MKKPYKYSVVMILALLGSILSKTNAELIADGTWQVRKGDTLYRILRDTKQRINGSTIQNLVTSNPNAFVNGDANQLIVGAILNLDNPNAKIISERLTAEPKTKPIKPLVSNKPTTPATTLSNNTPETPKTSAAQNNVPKVAAKPTHAKTAATKPNSIGRVVAAIGGIEAIDPSGNSRNIERNSVIYSGDTLKTAANGHSQVRFIDGALLAVRPNSQLQINQYQYGKQAKTEKSILTLLQGGFRTITGAIGRKTKSNYQVITSVATIGIRGTHYGLRLCSDNECNGNKQKALKQGLYGGVVDGAIAIKNQAGEFVFTNDEYFHVPGIDANPKGLLRPPGIVFDGKELQAKRVKQAQQQAAKKASQKQRATTQKIAQKVKREQIERLARTGPLREQAPLQAIQRQTGLEPNFSVGNDINEEQGGTSTETATGATSAPPGSRIAISFLNIDASTNETIDTADTITSIPNTGNFILLDDFDPNNIILLAAGKEDMQGTEFARLANGTPTEFGGEPSFGVFWGRWDGAFEVTNDGVPGPGLGSFHYIGSQNTLSLGGLQNLGPLGSDITFNPIAGAGTLPTDLMGNVGNYTGASLGIDFLAQRVSSYQVDVQHGNDFLSGQLVNPTSFNELFNGQGLLLQGFCSGSGACPATVSLRGNASLVFVNGPGGPAEAAFSSFSLTSDDPMQPPVGTTGTLLFVRGIAVGM